MCWCGLGGGWLATRAAARNVPVPAPLHHATASRRLLQWGQHVAVCGEGPLFGNWDVKK